MHVRQRAAIMDIGANAVRQLAAGDRRRGIRRVEGDGDIHLAVAQKLALRRIVERIGLAAAPQVRRRRVEPVPERRRHRIEVAVLGRLVERRGILDRFQQDLFQEGQADKVRRLRIGKAARVGADEFGQRIGILRRCGKARAVMDKDKLGPAPGRFAAIGRLGKIKPDRRQRCGIGKAP